VQHRKVHPPSICVWLFSSDVLFLVAGTLNAFRSAWFSLTTEGRVLVNEQFNSYDWVPVNKYAG